MRMPADRFDRLVAPAQAPLINIGAGADLSIGELAALVAEVLGYRGEFVYDASKPDGAPRKLLDSSRIEALGWKPGLACGKGSQPLTRISCGASPFSPRLQSV